MSALRPSLADRIRGLRQRLRSLSHRDATEQEMSAELAFHVDMQTEQNIRAGMTPDEARRAALREFGGVGRIAEQVRETRKVAWLEDLMLDLRHAIRDFRRTPGFTLTAIAALGLGIGANAAVFSVVHGVVLAPLPFAEPDRLVRIWESNPAQNVERGHLSPGSVIDLRARSRSLERVALFTERDFLLTSEGRTWESHAASISPVMIEMLGVRPMLGDAFPPEDPRGESLGNIVLISHELWQQRFGGDPGIIGKHFDVDYRWTYRVVGVMPPGFSYPVGAEVWMPLGYGISVTEAERQLRFFSAVGQLRSGHTIEQASRDVAGISAQIAIEHPASNAGWTLELMRLDRSIVGDTRTTLVILLALAGCVLLVACANVATLAIARATARAHETAVRVALGAGRSRLVRQWAAEGLLLAVLGGAAGLLVGYWSTRLFLSLAPSGIPRLEEVTFGPEVIGFVVIVTLITAVLIGLAPALRLRDGRPLDAMRSRVIGTARAGTGARAWLVAGQVALTMVLTVAAALLLRSFERLQATDLGYSRRDILSAEVRVPLGRFPREARGSTRVRFYQALTDDLAAIPGVRSVAGTTKVPLSGELGSGSFWRFDAPGALDGKPPTSAADQWKAGFQVVTPDYFATMGIPVVRGRHFAAVDRFPDAALDSDSAPTLAGVAIINETMASRFWPDADPIGQRIVLFDDRYAATYRTIIGIVGDARVESVATAPSPVMFLPFDQRPRAELSLVLRTDLPPQQLVTTVTNRLRAFDPALSVNNVRPLEDVVGHTLMRPRFTLLLVGIFAALALIIAAVGIFGVVGFLVTRRTQEIGIRLALGARPANLLWLVLRDGMRPVVIGAMAGCLAAVAVARAMQALLYGIAPLDALSFVTAATLLLAASLVAALLPARRAAALDPLQALRAE